MVELLGPQEARPGIAGDGSVLGRPRGFALLRVERVGLFDSFRKDSVDRGCALFGRGGRLGKRLPLALVTEPHAKHGATSRRNRDHDVRCCLGAALVRTRLVTLPAYDRVMEGVLDRGARIPHAVEPLAIRFVVREEKARDLGVCHIGSFAGLAKAEDVAYLGEVGRRDNDDVL